MYLKNIHFSHFRNFNDRLFEFDEDLTLVVGENALGKTNLLEGIYFLMTGKGIKDDKQEELIQFDHTTADIRGSFISRSGPVHARILLEKNNTLKKGFFIDKSRKKLFTYATFTPAAVLFSPSLISIIDGRPSLRRKFIDILLSTIDLEYKKRLNNYESALRKRNKILEKFHNVEKLKEELNFWDVYLIEQGSYVAEKRQWFVDAVNSDTSLDDHEFSCAYLRNTISIQTLEDSFQKQLYQRRTLVGPQRDDIRIFKKKKSKNIDVHKFSSRGEQRLALFWLILHQLHIYSNNLDYKPILLLDDIFSELDQSNKKVVTDLVHSYQTIITTTEGDLIKQGNLKGYIIEI